MRDQVSQAVGALMITLVHDVDFAKRDAVGYHGTQELVMIARNKGHWCSAFGMSQDPAHYVGMALAPPPAILLYLPGIDYVAHEIEMLAGVVLEEIVQEIGLAIPGA